MTCFVTWCINMLKVAIEKWVNCNNKGMHMVSNNTQTDCGTQAMIGWAEVCQETFPTPLHTDTLHLTHGRFGS